MISFLKIHHTCRCKRHASFIIKRERDGEKKKKKWRGLGCEKIRKVWDVREEDEGEEVGGEERGLSRDEGRRIKETDSWAQGPAGGDMCATVCLTNPPKVGSSWRLMLWPCVAIRHEDKVVLDKITENIPRGTKVCLWVRKRERTTAEQTHEETEKIRTNTNIAPP